MADLSAFATKEKADDGVILPVKIDGIKFPLALKIYGGDSDVVREYERNKVRKLGIGRKGKADLDEDDIEEILEDKEGALVRIGGIYSYDWKKKKVVDNDPVILFGKTLGCDTDSYEYLFEQMPAVEEWVRKQSNDRANFLAVGKKN